MYDGAIAIVGASCRLPGAAGLAAFWRLLSEGIDAVSEIDERRWSTRFFHHPRPGEPGKSHTWAAGLVDGIDLFEPGFFGISPREAAEMDPQQRLLLELVWHAAEDAGIPMARLAGSATGVYIGASSTDYGDLRLGDPASGGAHFVIGMTLSILANRISHSFDLRGPSLVIDTACSSSLVALHHACAALRAGEVETAIVGGVNLLLSPYPFLGFAQAGMLSRSGRCHAFDARADGYVRGEGGGVVILKRLDGALAGDDPVRATILGTGINASGHTLGLSQPSDRAQAELLRRVYRDAGVAPDDLAFFEMHGTGTPAGDPVEAAAVGAALAGERSRPLPIGSVKSNIGHLEPASGMAGLLKAMLAFEHGILPASLHCRTPNPAIPFARLNLRLAGAAEPIADDSGYCAGINSFGFGGANAHAIIARAPPRPAAAEPPEAKVPPLLISARSDAALKVLAQSWRETLTANLAHRAPGLVRASARRRDQHAHRLVVLGDDAAGTVAALDDFAAGGTSPAIVSGAAVRDGKLAFAFSGNGAQWLGMGGEAYRTNAAFRDAIAPADLALRPLLGWSVVERIADGLDPDQLLRADIAQPILFAIQTGIAGLLRRLGVHAAGHVGHSAGDIAAAWAAGALSLDAAARIVAVRSRHQERTRGAGHMATLALTPMEAEALLAELDAGLELAAVNGANAVSIAGSSAAITRLGEVATGRGIAWRPLDLDFAFHSAAMDPIRDGILGDLAGISSAAPQGDLASSVTGGLIGAGTLDPEYWWRNIRHPVRFAEAAAVLVAGGYRIFVEIGPNPVLRSYLRDALRVGGSSGQVLATLDRRSADGDPFPAIAARIHVAGHDLTGGPPFDGPNDPRGLPLYPWQRERFWFTRTIEGADPTHPVFDHPLLGFRHDGALPSWTNHVDTALFPWLADHRVGGASVLPAAAMLDMALAAARVLRPEARVLVVADVELRRMLPIEGERTRELQSAIVSPDGDWRLSSRRRLADEPLTLHAVARLVAADPAAAALPRLRGTAEAIVEGEVLYRRAGVLGLDYGAGFRTVTQVELLDRDTALATLDPAVIADLDGAHLIHPALLDGALQALLALLADEAAPGASLLPWRFGQVRAVAPFGRAPHRAELHLTRRGTRSAAADIALFDAAGALVAELADCWFRRVELGRSLDIAAYALRVDLVPAPLDATPALAVLDRIGEIVARRAVAREDTGEAERALLLDALVAAIAQAALRQGSSAPALERLAARFGAATEGLPEVAELWRLILAETSEMVGELALLAAAAEASPPPAAMVEQLRQASPVATAGLALIGDVLEDIAASWPRDRPLRVLDLGGGTQRRLDRLAQLGIGITRVAGDDGDGDIAISAHAGLDATALAPLRDRLAPGGVLLAAEPSPSPLWELLLGDDRPRSTDQWREGLAAAGFTDIGTAPITTGPWPSLALWARAPDRDRPAVPSPASRSIALLTPLPAFADGLARMGHAVAADGTEVVVLAIEEAGDPVARTAELIALFARAAAQAAERRIPLWLVTAGSQQAPGATIGAALWALGRVLINEIPHLDLRLLDLPAAMPWAERRECLARELAAAGTEREIVWTAAGRHVPRLRRGLPSRWAGPAETVALASERPGGMERLAWARKPPRAVGPGEIAVAVHAAALNFRDVMAATGLLPEEALLDGFAGAALGLECAGVVREVGTGVAGIAVGDRVAGFAPAALASHVVTRAQAVMPLPPTLGFAAAATLPVAFVTVAYALGTLGRLMQGETVLIHAASGGVGLAALQYAKGRGAVVIATAGSAVKRAFLRLAGADHVFDSRDLGFVDAVRAATGGAGVDVVLNSLSGEAMAASLDLLKPFGRFLELGKRDFYENRRLRLRPLRQNISYFAIDVDQLPMWRPELARALLEELAAILAAGAIRPLACRVFAFAEAEDAFRLMQCAGHIGKIVLVPDGNAGLRLGRALEPVLRGDGAYVVTGGLDGFGFAAARWLAQHGARSVALLGRRGAATPGAGERIAALEAAGATVAVHAVDVADRAILAATLDRVREATGPIRGIVHAAAAFTDAMAADLDAADIEAGLRAKLGGALLLDELTRDDPLELFLLFSSATTLIGAPGQGVYVAANAALAAVARRRQAEGRPALAVAWGPIADTGRLAARPEQRAALARRLGARPLPAATALSGLAAMLASGLPVVGLADTGWNEARQVLPLLASPLFAELRDAAEAAPLDERLTERLAALDGDGARDLLEAVVAEAAASVLRLPVADLDRRRPLADLGMDSLMAVELRLAIESRLRLDLPPVALAEGASVAALAARLAAIVAQPRHEAEVLSLAERYEDAGKIKSAAAE